MIEAIWFIGMGLGCVIILCVHADALHRRVTRLERILDAHGIYE